MGYTGGATPDPTPMPPCEVSRSAKGTVHRATSMFVTRNIVGSVFLKGGRNVVSVKCLKIPKYPLSTQTPETFVPRPPGSASVRHGVCRRRPHGSYKGSSLPAFFIEYFFLGLFGTFVSCFRTRFNFLLHPRIEDFLKIKRTTLFAYSTAHSLNCKKSTQVLTKLRFP